MVEPVNNTWKMKMKHMGRKCGEAIKKLTAQEKWMMEITRKWNPEGKEIIYRGLEKGLEDLMI